jgi:hypothetical protein
MRYRTLALAALVVVALVASVRAAELAGSWTAKFETQVGEQSYTFTFVSAGGQITGTAKSNLLGDTKLTDIKVDGDKVTFTENASFMEVPLTIAYTGNFAGNDEIKFTRVVADTPETFVAKRSK